MLEQKSLELLIEAAKRLDAGFSGGWLKAVVGWDEIPASSCMSVLGFGYASSQPTLALSNALLLGQTPNNPQTGYTTAPAKSGSHPVPANRR